MTKTEQRRFVKELCKDIQGLLLANSGKWPKNWDGHELRYLVKLAADDVAAASVLSRGLRDARFRSFQNFCVAENLP